MNPLSNDELISAYLDGELSGEEQQRAERLLAADAESRQLLDELRSLRTGMESLPRHQLDEEFAGRVLDQAERSMIAGEVTGGDDTTGTGTAEADKFVAPVDEHGMSRDRLVRLIAWPAIAIAAAVMIMVFLPPGADHIARHDEAAAPAPSSTAASSAMTASDSSAEMAASPYGKAAEKADSLGGRAESKYRQAGGPSTTQQPGFNARSPAALAPADGPEFADKIAAEPSADFGQTRSYEESRVGKSSAAKLAPPLALEEAPSLDERDSELERKQEQARPAASALAKTASRDEKLRTIDAVAVLNVARPIGKDREASLTSVWSRHQLVAMALPAEARGGQTDALMDLERRSAADPDDARARRGAGAGQAKRQATKKPARADERAGRGAADEEPFAEPPATEESEKEERRQADGYLNASGGDRVFLVEGTEAQVRAALAELAEQPDSYRFAYRDPGRRDYLDRLLSGRDPSESQAASPTGSKKKRPALPSAGEAAESSADQSAGESAAETSQRLDGGTKDDANKNRDADDDREAKNGDKADDLADAPADAEEADGDAKPSTAREATKQSESDLAGRPEGASLLPEQKAKTEEEADGVLRDFAATKELPDADAGGKASAGGEERRIRVMVVFRSVAKEPARTPAAKPAAPSDATDE